MDTSKTAKYDGKINLGPSGDSDRSTAQAQRGDEQSSLNRILKNSSTANVTTEATPTPKRNREHLNLNNSSVNGSRGRIIDLNNSLKLFATPESTSTSNSDRPPPNLTVFRELHDLTKLDCVTLKNVLECLRERYRVQQYYTYAGPILLSLNSCQKISRVSLIEDVSRMSWYFIDDERKQKENQDRNSKASKKPHVFDIGMQCLRNLTTVGSHQIILISGESGAGKTTATQQLIKYFTENNSRNFGANRCSNLDKKIYFATIILESLGNAKTQANPNSSRFGRLVQLNYNKEVGKITGAEIQTYLLEKHRVAKYDFQCERTFHIFYYILCGLKNGTIKIPNVNWKMIKYLVPEHLVVEAQQCDEEEVIRLQHAVQALNMDIFSEIINIIFATAMLLFADFVPECDSSSEEEFRNSIESPYKTEFTISNLKVADLAAELLGVTSSELVDILIARKITAGGAHRHSIFRKPCERISECEERLHALTSFIYDRIFMYVLDHLNLNMKGDTYQDPNNLTTLSLLDLYGFENFNVNSLEQICINYANERLQKINVSIVKSYYEQSIPPDEVMIPPTELIRIENELCLRIEELHGHIFSFFDEECLLKRTSEDKDVQERMSLSLSSRKSRFIRTGKPHEPICKFTIMHYATTVEYQLSGIVQKNKDHIPPEFQDILKSSTNPFINNLFKHDLIRSRNASGATPNKSVFTVSSNKNTRGKTILTRFKQSVEELMSRLSQAETKDVYFIRCIRPNADLLAGNFSMDIVEKQLYACGIADVVKIAGNGFPIRMNFTNFVKTFPKIISFFCNGHLEPQTLQLIFEKKNQMCLKFGKSMIFMSENCWRSFKKVEKVIILQKAIIIQRSWKNYLKQQEKLRASHLKEIMKSSEVETPNDVEEGRDSLEQISSLSSQSNRIVNENLRIRQSLTQAEHLHQQLIENRRPLLYFGKNIASRTPVHTLPIKFYTKRMCLPFCERPPQRLTANGLPDAFEDFGIVLLNK